MPAARLSMLKIRELLRLRGLGLTGRQIARSLKIGNTTVSDHLRRARAAGLSWPIPEDLDDEALQRLLFVPRDDHRPSRPSPDWTSIQKELRRKHVTLALLWEEYRGQHPDGYQYSQFCNLYQRWLGTLHPWMRQHHKGGEKLFVDYSGDGIPWVDRRTGECFEAQLFVAVMGASNETFAEVTRTQQLPDWIQSHVHAFAFFGGVARVVVPDQTRTAVKKVCRYDPELNPAYADLAKHYETCIIPARPRHPRDKAKVEVGVLIAQRWIIARLRNRTFYSPAEINVAVRECLQKLNNRRMRKLGRSRQELFEEIDKPHLTPLPDRPFEFADWKTRVRVNLDYHVEYEKNYYSVPYQHLRKEVDIRATSNTVEIFLNHSRIASHVRRRGEHHFSTRKDHMPRAHQQHAEWSPSRLLGWAKKVGPSARAVVEHILSSRPHPEQGYRACLGILRLGKRYSEERLEKACARALASKNPSYQSISSILKNRLEDQPLPQVAQAALPLHENVRGGNYYV